MSSSSSVIHPGVAVRRFDLIVFSEILYYLGDDDLEQVLKNAVAALEPEGTLLAGYGGIRGRLSALRRRCSWQSPRPSLGSAASFGNRPYLPGRGVLAYRGDAGVGG